MSRIEKPYVLLVDDNEPTRTLMTALLQREFMIVAASDGIDAVEQLKTRSFAAVLLDLRMPLLDGYGVLDFLQQNAPDMLKRVIVVTAALSKSEMERARDYGVHAIVEKPFEIEVLLAAVRSCAGTGGVGFNVLCSSGPVILLLADLLRQRLM